MIISAEAQKTLTGVVASGAELCAAKLADATHDKWRVVGVELSLDEAGPFAGVQSSIASDTYGSRFTFPGGSFLVLFSGKSGYLITTAYTRDFQDAVENMEKREAVVLSEVSNILLNPLVGHLAAAWGVGLIISAPNTGISSRRDHLSRALADYADDDRLAATYFLRLDSPQLFSECEILLFLDRNLVGKIGGGGAPAP